MPQGRTVLIALALLSSGIWVGSLVCLALVSTVATRELDPVVRVSLFRSIGRLYGRVGTAALLISIATGLALAGSPSEWTAATAVAGLLSVAIVALTGAGVVQARQMTKRRTYANRAPEDEGLARAVQRGAAIARTLRGLIAVGTLAVIWSVAVALTG